MENIVAWLTILGTIGVMVTMVLTIPLALDSKIGQRVMKRLKPASPAARRVVWAWLPTVVMGVSLVIGVTGYTVLIGTLKAGNYISWYAAFGFVLSMVGFGSSIVSKALCST
jgi:hypothetical protein